MKVICAWCRDDLGEKEPLEDLSLTHTICAECAKRVCAQASGVRQQATTGEHEVRPYRPWRLAILAGAGR